VEDALVRARCGRCGRGLAFDEWSRGMDRCQQCAPHGVSPAAAYVPGPRSASLPGRSPVAVPGGFELDDDETARYEQLLDDIPEELVDELIAALEEEARRRATAEEPKGPLQGVLEELGVAQSPRDAQWAMWGFAIGFAGNVALVKYAQMASGAAMSEFVAPVLVGGLVAGGACALLGWGLARLKG